MGKSLINDILKPPPERNRFVAFISLLRRSNATDYYGSSPRSSGPETCITNPRNKTHPVRNSSLGAGGASVSVQEEAVNGNGKKSRTANDWIYIGIGGILVVLIAVGLIAATRGSTKIDPVEASEGGTR